MWRCETCLRHVMRVAPVCPFCTGTRIAALGLAAVAPIVLSACYGVPPCHDDQIVDNDGDGWSEIYGNCGYDEPLDCNDADPAIHPGAEEICDNEVDENCDGILAGAEQDEVCGNGLDDDCDGAIDELDCTPLYTDSGDSGTGDTGTRTTGAITLAITWQAGVPVETCSEADVTALEITLDLLGLPAASAVPATCDDQPVLLSDLPAGTYAMVVRGQSSDGVRLWDSGPVAVEVSAGQTEPIDVVLACSSTTVGACG